MPLLIPVNDTFASALFKRLAQALPHKTGNSLEEVELSPLVGIIYRSVDLVHDTQVVDYIVSANIAILKEIQVGLDEAELPADPKCGLLWQLAVVVLRVLTTLTEHLWDRVEDRELLRIPEDQHWKSSIEPLLARLYLPPVQFQGRLVLLNGTLPSSQRTPKYRRYRPRPLRSSVAQEIIQVVSTLKLLHEMRKMLVDTNWPNYKYDPELVPFRSTVQTVDDNCSMLLFYSSAANPQEMYDYASSRLAVIKYGPINEHTRDPHLELFGNLFLSREYVLKYLQLVRALYSHITRLVHQHLLVAFLTRLLNGWILTDTKLFVDAIKEPVAAPLSKKKDERQPLDTLAPPSTSSLLLPVLLRSSSQVSTAAVALSLRPRNPITGKVSSKPVITAEVSDDLTLVLVADGLFDLLISHQDALKSVVRLFLTLLVVFFPAYFGRTALLLELHTIRKIMTRDNKKERFLHQGTKSLDSISSYADLDYGVTLIQIGTLVLFYDPQLPLVQCARTYLTKLHPYIEKRTEFPGKSASAVEDLRVGLVCAAAVLRQDDMMRKIHGYLTASDHERDMELIRILLIALKRISSLPLLSRAFPKYMKELTPTLRKLLIEITPAMELHAGLDVSTVLTSGSRNTTTTSTTGSVSGTADQSTLDHSQKQLYSQGSTPRSRTPPTVAHGPSAPLTTGLSSTSLASASAALLLPLQPSTQPALAEALLLGLGKLKPLVRGLDRLLRLLLALKLLPLQKTGSGSLPTLPTPMLPPQLPSSHSVPLLLLISQPSPTLLRGALRLMLHRSYPGKSSEAARLLPLRVLLVAAESDPGSDQIQLMRSEQLQLVYVDLLLLFAQSPDCYLGAESASVNPMNSNDLYVLPIVAGLLLLLLQVLEAAGELVTTLLEHLGRFNSYYDYSCYLVTAECTHALAVDIAECRLQLDRLVRLLELLGRFMGARLSKTTGLLTELLPHLVQPPEGPACLLSSTGVIHDLNRCGPMLIALECAVVYSLCLPHPQMFRQVRQVLRCVLAELLQLQHTDSCTEYMALDVYAPLVDDAFVVTGLVALQKHIRKVLRNLKPHEGVVRAWRIVYDRWGTLLVRPVLELTHATAVEFRNCASFLASVLGVLLGDEKTVAKHPDILEQFRHFVVAQVDRIRTGLPMEVENVKAVLLDEMHPKMSPVVCHELFNFFALLLRNMGIASDETYTVIDSLHLRNPGVVGLRLQWTGGDATSSDPFHALVFDLPRAQVADDLDLFIHCADVAFLVIIFHLEMYPSGLFDEVYQIRRVFRMVMAMVLEDTSTPALLRLRIRLCKGLTVVELRREELCIEGELHMRAILVRDVLRWLDQSVFFTHTQPHAPQPHAAKGHHHPKHARAHHDVEYLFVDLAVEASRALLHLLVGHELALPHVAMALELKNTKKLVFDNYFLLFYRLLEHLNNCVGQGAAESTETGAHLHHAPAHAHTHPAPLLTLSKKAAMICENIVVCLLHLFQANVDLGLKLAITYCYHANRLTRMLFIHVFTNIINDMLTNNGERRGVRTKRDSPDTVLARYFRLHPHVLVAAVDSCPVAQLDLLAAALLQLYRTEEELLAVTKILVEHELEHSSRVADLLRQNSIATRLMLLYARTYSGDYIQRVLKPTLEMLALSGENFEVERETPGHDGVSLGNDLEYFTKYLLLVVEAITELVATAPVCIRHICRTIDECVAPEYPELRSVAIGSFMYLRFFGPVIVLPELADIYQVFPDRALKRSLIQLAKAIQHMANGTFASIKWAHVDPQQPVFQKLQDQANVFLLELVKLPSADESVELLLTAVRLQLDERLPPQYLHRFVYDFFGPLRKLFCEHMDVKNNAPDVDEFREFGKVVYDLGQPRSSTGFQILSFVKSGSGDTGNIGMQYGFTEKQLTQDLRDLVEVPFVLAGITSEGMFTLNVCPLLLQGLHRWSPELVLYRIYQVAERVWGFPFILTMDFSESTDMVFVQRLFELVVEQMPDMFRQNCKGVYWLNLLRLLYAWFVKLYAKFGSHRVFDPSKLVHEFRLLMDSMDLLIGQLTFSPLFGTLINQKRVVFEDVMYYNRAINRYLLSTVQLGDEYIQICDNLTVTIKINNQLKHTRLTEVIRIADIDLVDATTSTGVPNEFTIVDRVLGERHVLYLARKMEIMRAVYYVQLRVNNLQSLRDSALEDESMEDWVAYLFNLCFAGLVAADDDTRLELYGFLLLLCLLFDVQLGPELRSSSNAKVYFPPDNVLFVQVVLETVARQYPNATFDFIEEFCRVYSRLLLRERTFAVLYLAPWTRNVYQYVFLAEDDEGPEKTEVLIQLLAQALVLDDACVSAFSIQVWRGLCLEDRLIGLILRGVVQVAVDRDTDGLLWQLLILLVVGMPTFEMCCWVINRLREVAHIPVLPGKTLMIAHASWVEITILLSICTVVFFDLILFAELYLLDVLFIVSMFLGMGPMPLRHLLHGLVCNVMHSFCNKENLSDEARVRMLDIVSRLTGPRAMILFGLTHNGNEESVYTEMVDHGAPAGFTNIKNVEYVCGHLAEFFDAVSGANVKPVWRVKWNLYVVDAAFRNGLLLQPRALRVLGFLGRTGVTDNLTAKLLRLLRTIGGEHAEQLQSLPGDQPVVLEAFVAGAYALSCISEGLAPTLVFGFKLMWLASVLMMLDHEQLYHSGVLMGDRLFARLNDLDVHRRGLASLYMFALRESTGDLYHQFEELVGVHGTVENIDTVCCWLGVRGLLLTQTREASVLFLKGMFQVRHTGIKRRHLTLIGVPADEEPETDPAWVVTALHIPLLLFVYLTSDTNLEMHEWLGGVDSLPYMLEQVHLGEGVLVPRVLVDYYSRGTRPLAVALLYLAGALFKLLSADDHVRMRFAVLFRTLTVANQQLAFMVYFLIRDYLLLVALLLVPVPFLAVVLDVCCIMAQPEVFEGGLLRFPARLAAMLEEFKVTGMSHIALEQTQPGLFDNQMERLCAILDGFLERYVETE